MGNDRDTRQNNRYRIIVVSRPQVIIMSKAVSSVPTLVSSWLRMHLEFRVQEHMQPKRNKAVVSKIRKPRLETTTIRVTTGMAARHLGTRSSAVMTTPTTLLTESLSLRLEFPIGDPLAWLKFL